MLYIAKISEAFIDRIMSIPMYAHNSALLLLTANEIRVTITNS